MVHAASLALLLVAAVSCSSGRPLPAPSSAPPVGTSESSKPADPAAASLKESPCDFKVVAMSDPAQKQIRCANGESFVVRRGDDGMWHEEMKVRAGLRPGYATPDEAARAHCCPPASE